ncbi:dihydrolipoamide acetyltransferase family protein [Lewinella cohaerens]|uniref:dihydrolipoamide acetyltransferase family protein n=1 Tax=Lewinella cohaerens TaxID=70995 RepID=UPI0003825876|nr:dihydrolipoamide acetyltransferase family protein [Lewinella cohaerens]
MAQVELIMPKMGESIMEATILNWVKKEGDQVEMDETILEIATDKVDSEVPSPVAGTISKIMFQVDDVVEIGKVIAIIATEGENATPQASPSVAEAAPASAPASSNGASTSTKVAAPAPESTPQPAPATVSVSSGDRFYSPLVRNIAKEEGVSQAELDALPGTGKEGRVTKKDMLAYLENRSSAPAAVATPQPATARPASPAIDQPIASSMADASGSGNVEIIEMDRMRRLIADHMVNSKHTSPHVTSFVEADVTNIVNWREKNKHAFQQKFGEKITFTPLFIEAIVRAIHDYPMINVSVDGKNIIRKKNINIGMAAALPTGNLIVPVIKNADHLSLIGLTKAVNDLANRARGNKLKPEDIQDGTFTVTNVGTFGNVMGTPIINQPQAAIMAVGAIRKRPAVVETEFGDLIAVRHMMFLSMSYDHRIVDGMLGGSFLRRVGDYLEAFDANRSL